jgi:hypothetical protein
MGQGYIRNDSGNNIANGNVIDAADLDGEFDAIVAAFVAATGHTHDGTAAEGGAVTVVGPAQEYVGSGTAFYPKTDATYDLGQSANSFNVAYIETLNLGGTAITSTAAELNKLDGVTATPTELNYVAGVTSAIQTQLDAKQASDADLTAIAALAKTDGNIIVGNGSAWVAESGATARTSLGVSIGSDVQAYDANLPTWPATVDATEVGYLNGVTSAIQTQFTGKVGTSHTGDVDITGELTVDSYNESYAAVTSTTNAVTADCEAANMIMHTLTENTTFTFSNPPASGTGYSMSIEIIQDAGATGYTVTWPTSVDWPAATAPTLTATASAKDVFVFTTRDGGTTWYGFTAGQALA